MATIDFNSFRPLPTDYTFQGSEKVLIQPLGWREPFYITWERFTALVGSGGGGSASEYIYVTQSGNYTVPDYSTQEKAVDGTSKVFVITGDLSNTLALPSNWVSRDNEELDNTKENYLYTEVTNGVVFYNIIKTDISPAPDLVAPTFVSASTNSAGTLITITLSKALAGTPNFTLSSNTISSQTIVGSTVQIVPGTTIIYGNTISASGGTGLTNITGEASFAGLTNQSITNNVPVPSAPVLQTAVTNSTGDIITLTYNKTLTGTPAYTVSGGKTITNQVIAGSTVLITVTPVYTNLDSITVSGGGPKESTGTISVAILSAQPVTNNVVSLFTNLKSQAAGNLNSITPIPNLNFGNGAIDNAFSFSCYMKFSDLSTQNFAIYSTQGWNVSNNTSGKAVFLLPSGAAYIAMLSPVLSPNIWYHFVGTYNGNGSTSGLNIYTNGSNIGENGNNTGTYIALDAYNSSSFMQIGNNSILVDEVVIYNKELSSGEASQIYNSGTVIDVLTLPFASNVKAYWRFENNLNDSSTSGYTLTGTPTYSTDKP